MSRCDASGDLRVGHLVVGGLVGLTDFSGRPRSGLSPYPVIGIVVDNVDPEKQGRIKVKFPTLHQEAESGWIRQASPMAGKERGFYALPEVGDEVLVVFQNGDASSGIVVGQLWNGRDLPPQEAEDDLPGADSTDTGASQSVDSFTEGSEDLEKNDRRFWKSRSGHLLVFDDTTGAETVQIWDKDHTLSLVFDSKEKRIILANTGGDLHIRTKYDLYLEAGQNIKWRAGANIEGESVGDTRHKAANWTSEAESNATLKAGISFKIEAGTELTCKSKMTTVEGEAMLTAKSAANTTIEGNAMVAIRGGVVTLN